MPAIKGWRRTVFGEDALRLRNGEIGLQLAGDQVAIVESKPPEEATE